MKVLIIPLLSIMTVTVAHADFLDKLNNALGTVNKVLGAVSGSPNPTSTTQTPTSTPQFAIATEQQTKQIASALMTSTNNVALDAKLAHARENIAQVLVMGSCGTKFSFGAGKYQSPQAETHNLVSAMFNTTYHPNNQCMTVKNIGSWKQPANNALAFQVVYYSDVSGETVKRNVEFIDEYGNNNWLVKKHSSF